MRYQVRTMLMEDVSQVSEIEREVFSTQWPPTSYKRELQNKLAYYLVAVEEPELGGEANLATKPGIGIALDETKEGWLSRVRGFFGQKNLSCVEKQLHPNQHVVGAVGFWLMLDEAHITTIGVRKEYQRRGIGELLMIKTLELAQELGARVVTLEVRVANIPAQSLYEKYGFNRVGLRRGYYSENREDALIMTTDHITSASCQARLQHLKEAHTSKWNLNS